MNTTNILAKNLVGTGNIAVFAASLVGPQG